ncbi:DUF6074 family protein [Bradyrhizobium sp. URHC0002]
MSNILPFPLSRRWVFIERQARRASELNQDAGERHIGYQLEVQATAMRRKGIDETLIARELHCMEAAIRVSLQRLLMGGAA